MNFAKLLLFTGVILLFICGNLCAQPQTAGMLKVRETKNEIAITSYLPSLFDGNGLFDRYLGQGKNYGFAHRIGYGLEFIRRIRGRHGIVLGANVYGRSFTPKFDHCGERLGIVNRRRMANFSAHYIRKIWYKKRMHVDVLFGLLFRTGYEGVTSRCWSSFDYFSDGYGLNDLGLSTGIKFGYYFTNHFHLTTDLRFTEFIYRHDKTRYEWYQNYAGQGSTRHFAALQLGLGYLF